MPVAFLGCALLRRACGKPCRFLSFGRGYFVSPSRPAAQRACAAGSRSETMVRASSWPISAPNLKPWPEQGDITQPRAPGLLDHEALVLRHGVEADLEPVDAPLVEAAQQAGAALEQGLHFRSRRLATAVGIAAAAELVIADLHAAAFHRRHEVEADLAGLVDDHRPPRPGLAGGVGQPEVDDDLARRDQAAVERRQQAADPGAGRDDDDVGAMRRCRLR